MTDNFEEESDRITEHVTEKRRPTQCDTTNTFIYVSLKTGNHNQNKMKAVVYSLCFVIYLFTGCLFVVRSVFHTIFANLSTFPYAHQNIVFSININQNVNCQ